MRKIKRITHICQDGTVYLIAKEECEFCNLDEGPEELQEPEEDRNSQYDTLEEKDIDRLDCPDNEFD